MRTSIFAILGLAMTLTGGALIGCDRAVEEPDTDTEGAQAADASGAVQLSPVHWDYEEGQMVPIRATRPDGTVAFFQYQVVDGKLQPLYGAPDLEDLDPSTLGVIEVGTDGTAPPAKEYIPSNAGGQTLQRSTDWVPAEIDSPVPPMQRDPSFRVRTDDFVAELQRDGHTVTRSSAPDTGPSMATELTRMTIDGEGKAEIYQFDDPVRLEAWYRLVYQLNTSLDIDPEQHCQVSGMTMLRTEQDLDLRVRDTFEATPRFQLEVQALDLDPRVGSEAELLAPVPTPDAS